MNIEIRQVGDKLRELRKKLNLKQDELVKYSNNTSRDKSFTRNLVSMVETGKAPLTKKLADCIEYNINKACEEQEKEINFDFKEVCKTPQEQIKELIDEYLNIISKKISSEESIKYAEKLISLAEEYTLYREVCVMCMKVGELSKKNDYDIAIKFFNQAYILKNELTSEEINWLALQMKYVYIIQKKYEMALNINYILEDVDNKNVIKNMYNNIICLNELEKYSDMNKEMKYILELIDKNSDIYLGLKMLEANMYYRETQYNKCIKVYNDLIKDISNINQKIPLKANLMLAKMKLGMDFDELLEEIISFDMEKIDKYQYLGAISIIAECCEKKNDIRSIKYYRLGLEKSLELKDKESFNNFIEGVINNSESNSKEEIEEILLYVRSGIENKLFDDGTILKVLLFFQKREKYDLVKGLLERAVS